MVNCLSKADLQPMETLSVMCTTSVNRLELTRELLAGSNYDRWVTENTDSESDKKRV